MARVISLLGKGGTGRSTLTLAMAQAEARQGKRVLLISLELASTIGSLLEQTLSAEPQEVEPGLSVAQFSTTGVMERNWKKLQSAEEEYLRIPLFREVYGQELGVIPGLDQLLVMAALRDWDKSDRYDLIFFDGGSALDLVRMFAVPEQLSWYVRRFGDAFQKSALGQLLSPFLEPLARSVLSVNFTGDSVRQTTGRITDVLDEGKSVMQNPERLLLYLVSTADPLAIAVARQAWGSAQLFGLTVGGALVRGKADWDAFTPLPLRSIPEAPLSELPAYLKDLAVAAPGLPRPFEANERSRTVRVFLPGFTKKQVELNQYGPELTIRAADQRRNFVLPAGFRGLRATGAKFQEGYLVITFG
ncbi:MAG: ArsA family ATPase [Gemmatimonadaceae bacterium]|nr:ArsA family ATPase [Gloeobacterales cyanobacterium ES-bin-141]